MPEAYPATLVLQVLDRRGDLLRTLPPLWLVMTAGAENDAAAVAMPVRRGQIVASDLARQLERLGENPGPIFAEMDAIGG
jgi:predicted NAD/FAD-binding protein